MNLSHIKIDGAADNGLHKTSARKNTAFGGHIIELLQQFSGETDLTPRYDPKVKLGSCQK